MNNRIARCVLCVLCIAAMLAAHRAAASAGEPFRIAREAMPRFVLEPGLRPFVSRAVADVATDLERIFGVRPAVETGRVATANAILLTRSGDGFESYRLASERGNVLRISGSDDRGVMFGLYRFASDFLGVDPFWWFARLPSGESPSHAPRAEMRWASIDLAQAAPSFRYRAWFVNDEDFLNGLMPEANGRRAIDYPRYHVCFGLEIADRLYEAAARAGFNTMICASYVDILNPDERRLVDVATSRGFYITMHHQEPVGASGLMLDLHFPEMRGTTYASHPDLWRKAWRRYATAWAKYPDVIYQIGLRGRKDKAFWVTDPKRYSSETGAVSPEETRRRAGLISQAMREQVALIREVTGSPRPLLATQLWMEGADFYRKGLLDIPEGTLVIFSDNSPGLKFQPDIGGVRHLPAGRAYGLYYHLALVQGNHRCEIVPPARTHEILCDAYAKGAQDLLLVNVSNVRPFLYTIPAICEMARDLNGFDPEAFARRWTERRFGKAAPRVKRALDLYYAAFETMLSRDASSSYGSPRARAVIPLFNDGVLCDEIRAFLQGVRKIAFHGVDVTEGDPISPFRADPDVLAPASADQHSQVNQDMRAFPLQPTRIGPRAAAEVAGMTRCLDALESIAPTLTETEREVLFQRLGYQAGFLRAACRCVSELALARDAQASGATEARRRHLKAALTASEERDALDRRYASGVWARWYDRDIIYPYTTLTPKLRALCPPESHPPLSPR